MRTPQYCTNVHFSNCLLVTLFGHFNPISLLRWFDGLYPPTLFLNAWGHCYSGLSFHWMSWTDNSHSIYLSSTLNSVGPIPHHTKIAWFTIVIFVYDLFLNNSAKCNTFLNLGLFIILNRFRPTLNSLKLNWKTHHGYHHLRFRDSDHLSKRLMFEWCPQLDKETKKRC